MKLEDLIDPIARAILARSQQKERVVEADEKMKCPKCGSQMTVGVSYALGSAIIYECHNCGYCEVKK